MVRWVEEEEIEQVECMEVHGQGNPQPGDLVSCPAHLPHFPGGYLMGVLIREEKNLYIIGNTNETEEWVEYEKERVTLQYKVGTWGRGNWYYNVELGEWVDKEGENGTSNEEGRATAI